jgi:hypothetical protein
MPQAFPRPACALCAQGQVVLGVVQESQEQRAKSLLPSRLRRRGGCAGGVARLVTGVRAHHAHLWAWRSMTLLTPGPATFPHPNIRLTDRIRFSCGAILVARFHRENSLISEGKRCPASRMQSARDPGGTWPWHERQGDRRAPVHPPSDRAHPYGQPAGRTGDRVAPLGAGLRHQVRGGMSGVGKPLVAGAVATVENEAGQG